MRRLLALQAVVAAACGALVWAKCAIDSERRAMESRLVQLRSLQRVALAKDDDGEIRILRVKPDFCDRDCEQLLHFSEEIVEINLCGSAITDRSAQYLSRLPRLRSLDVSHTEVTNQFCSGIRSLPELAWLNLSHTAIDDRSLQTLTSIKSLRSLDIRQTAVSPQGVKAFASARVRVHANY